jgi:prepilin-type N-terminal cleavage/methylation domain-containing protein
MNRKGFTLIELMIVVVIIGILAAIAIPNFMSMQKRAKDASVKANMHTLQLACEDFSTQADGIYAVDCSQTVEDATADLNDVNAKSLAGAVNGTSTSGVADILLPQTFKNPIVAAFNAWDQGDSPFTVAWDGTSNAGCVFYTALDATGAVAAATPSDAVSYEIRAQGAEATLPLSMTSGQ